MSTKVGLMLRRLALALAILIPPGIAGAQSTINPNVPATGSQMQSPVVRGNFSAAFNDVNALYATKLNLAGGTMTGRLVTVAPSLSGAFLNLPHGTAPTSPINGDLWTTTAGLFARINGVTTGPYGAVGPGSFAATAPITISFPGGGVTYACPTCATTTNGGPITATSPVSISAGGVVSINLSGITTVGTIGTGIWQGTNVDLAHGGTNANLTASVGGVVYSTASALGIIGGTSTAGQCLLSGSFALPTWGSCSGAAAVSSVANSDGTLTISPTTGAVTASMALGHANTWTAAQSHNSGTFKLNGATSGTTTLNAAATAGATTITLPAVTDTVATIGTADQTLSGGANVVTLALSSANQTIDCGARPLQQINLTSNITITAPASDGSCIVLLVNVSNTLVPTFSGFASASHGDALDATNGHIFYVSIFRVGSNAMYVAKAGQ